MGTPDGISGQTPLSFSVLNFITPGKTMNYPTYTGLATLTDWANGVLGRTCTRRQAASARRVRDTSAPERPTHRQGGRRGRAERRR